jgi:8-oxo-dGTP pyrophosphatase MutT (NUDIX family)
MLREISAGGVVVRKAMNGWEVAVIEPKREPDTDNNDKKRQKQILALPKGIVDPGEKADETAIREVLEETGIIATKLAKLTNIKYVYVRSWGDKQRVFKIVSFYLLRYQSGEIDQIKPEMRIEVKQALWIPLAGAESKLAHKGERDVVKLAQKYLQSHTEEVR